MKAIDSRIRKLEDQVSPGEGGPPILWVVTRADRELDLDQDRCIEILGECGFLPASRFGIVDLCGIPDGLNAEELEEFLRRNGAETCGPGGSQPAE